MPNYTEKTGIRSLTYSQWHRPGSIIRFTGNERIADSLRMIDIDGLDYMTIGGRQYPWLLVETAKDVGQEGKHTSVLEALAEIACKGAGYPIYAIALLYSESDDRNPGSDQNPPTKDIDQFKISFRWIDDRAASCEGDERAWRTIAPAEYVRFLLKARSHSATGIAAKYGWPLERVAEYLV